MNTPDPTSQPEASEDHVVHLLPPKKSAYRRWFSTLNPSVQLVLQQLWMPVFMCIMFILCYVGSFQHVAPRHVPVGVIGDTNITQTLTTASEKAAPGAMDFSDVENLAQAREQVRRGELGMAYNVEKNELVVASAHQAQAASLLPKLLAPLLPAAGVEQPPETDDVAPLGPHDMGMTPMYLMLTWCICGYLAAMFIGLMGGPLSRRSRYAIIVGVAAALSLLASTLVSFGLRAITGHFLALWGLGFCWAVAIGVAVNGLSYFLGRFIAAPAMTIFIFLSIPSSGAAMPKWMMPEFFQALNNVVVGSGITEMLKHLIYGVGPGYARGWIMMVCYLVAGLLLSWVGKPYWEWRRVRRLLSGKPTMFVDAQRANGRKNQREEKEILAAHGLKVRESDGALLRIPRMHGSQLRELSKSERERNRQLRLAETEDPQPPTGAFISVEDRSPATGMFESLDPAYASAPADDAKPAHPPRHREDDEAAGQAAPAEATESAASEEPVSEQGEERAPEEGEEPGSR